jgi:hypothetical protein
VPGRAERGSLVGAGAAAREAFRPLDGYSRAGAGAPEGEACLACAVRFQPRLYAIYLRPASHSILDPGP